MQTGAGVLLVITLGRGTDLENVPFLKEVDLATLGQEKKNALTYSRWDYLGAIFDADVC
jgi:hypothetical protein